MKTLILYTSKHGSTEKIVHYIQEQFECDTINILKNTIPPIDSYDCIILGGPIYMTSIHSRLKSYIEDNLSQLLTKKIGLFLVCLMDEDRAAEQFNNAYNEVLLSHSMSDGFFGGYIDSTKLSLLEKIITCIAFRKKEIHNEIVFSEVDKFISAINLCKS